MSEEEVPKHRYAVSIDDFLRFLVEVTGDTTCPACGNEQWTMIGTNQTDSAYRLYTSLRDGKGQKALNTFAIYCNECGFVRQHLARIVREWVDKNPAPEQLELENLDEAGPDDSEQI
ncbi:hypothetical protein [Pseudomonas sp. NPDC096925]|uniref:hypothetical protein n=1 Tax=Pseudomonas sp. NPDC096925 TaxID=3364484 RepID=UPI00383B1B51